MKSKADLKVHTHVFLCISLQNGNLKVDKYLSSKIKQAYFRATLFYSHRLKENGGSVRVVVAAEATTNPVAGNTALASMAGAVAAGNAQAAAATAPAVASNTPAEAGNVPVVA